MTLTVHALDHLVINVRDVEVSTHWYVAHLGVDVEQFDPGEGRPKRTSISFGHQKINLRPHETDTGEWFTGRAPQPGSDDLCFLTTSAPDAVVAHLTGLGTPIELGPVNKHGARGTLRSVYCRDPDGNLIEIASYPA